MSSTNKAVKNLLAGYEKEAREILVLMSDANSAASGVGEGYWSPIKYFLAYVDVASGELKKGEGRAVWLITEEESKAHGIGWPHNFKKGCIYRLLARRLIPANVPPGSNPSYYNNFFVEEVLEEGVLHAELEAVLHEYRTPVIISDDLLGELELNKDYGMFEGDISWLGEDVHVFAEVDIGDEASFAAAADALRSMVLQQAEFDAALRAFAANKLTAQANDWQEGEGAIITEQEFMGRIALTELSVTADGGYTAYYSDDDMFLGHIITVDGSAESGPGDAYIQG